MDQIDNLAFSTPGQATLGRRQLLKALAASGGAVASAALLPGEWARPVIEVGVLPAHAQTSGAAVGPNSITFRFSGGVQTFVVPAGVTRVAVEAWGAGGGNAYVLPGCPERAGDGAPGVRVSGAILTVTPSEELAVYVGGRGGDGTIAGSGLGGYNGGGIGGTGGGGGGGASTVSQAASNVVVAGGGGGGGYCDTCSFSGSAGGAGGAGGCSSGTAGVDGSGGTVGGGGGGGTQSGGGAGGASDVGGTGEAGGSGQGGDGCFLSGGGGGGGYYGGGGGGYGQTMDPDTGHFVANGGGGGGGSSLVPAGATCTAGASTGDGNGLVTISW